jgi:hypothetical protein
LEEFDQLLERKKMITKYITRKYDPNSQIKLHMDSIDTLHSYGEKGEVSIKRMEEMVEQCDALKEEMVMFFDSKRFVFRFIMINI